MILSSHGIIGSQITQFVGLLDDYSGASAAYSLRLLRSTYTGSAIKVRRSVGSPSEKDIGFVNNELDVADLESFCSGTDGFVVTWYDQSGNGYDATQSTAASQPQIVSSGSVILENGKPAVDFDGTSAYLNLNLTQALALTNSAYKTVAIVSSDSGITSTRNRAIFIGKSTSTRISFINLDSNTFEGSFNGFANRVIITFNTQQQYLAFGEDLNGTQAFYLNSTTSDTNSLGGTTNDATVAEISNATNTQYFNGTIQEIIMYPSDQSSNRSGIETNINDFYSIY